MFFIPTLVRAEHSQFLVSSEKTLLILFDYQFHFSDCTVSDEI